MMFHPKLIPCRRRRPAEETLDLLPLLLSDVGDVEVAVGAVEAEPPGIPKPVAPDLGDGAGRAHERVVGGNGVASPLGGRAAEWSRAGSARDWPRPPDRRPRRRRPARDRDSRRVRRGPGRRCDWGTAAPPQKSRPRWPRRPGRHRRRHGIPPPGCCRPGRCSARRSGRWWRSQGETRGRAVPARRRWRPLPRCRGRESAAVRRS